MSTRIFDSMAEAMAAAGRTARSPLSCDPVNHLLNRCTFGATAADRESLAHIGPDAWYAKQISLARKHQNYSANSHVAACGPLLGMNTYDLASTMTSQGKQYWWDAMDQLSAVTIGLQAFSPAQLFEVLVDVFSNHLNVPNHTGDVWSSRPSYDLDVIRKYALGSFTDMLLASCNHPAMLTYLNLSSSTKNTINENYGREVLELHTVGPIYSESDVKNTARMLSGRTMDQFGHYDYNSYIHATGKIKVLGFTNTNSSADGGNAAGNDLLRYLAAHPSTAKRLAQKLCTRFVSDTPSSGLVAAVAKAYTDNNTQILPMVKTILCSTEFWESRGAKVRRPRENLVATLRVLGVQPVDMPTAVNYLHWWAASMGDGPLDWPAPNGYADVATAWRSSETLIRLWNFQLGFAQGWWHTVLSQIDPSSLYGNATPATSGDAIDLLATRLVGAPLADADKQAILTYLNEPGTRPMAQSSMRWQITVAVALILHSPYHALH